MFSLPPLRAVFSKFNGVSVFTSHDESYYNKNMIDENHEGRTSGGYTFESGEHPRGEGGKFGDNGGSKPYIKKSGKVSETSKERVEEEKSQPKKAQHSSTTSEPQHSAVDPFSIKWDKENTPPNYWSGGSHFSSAFVKNFLSKFEFKSEWAKKYAKGKYAAQLLEQLTVGPEEFEAIENFFPGIQEKYLETYDSLMALFEQHKADPSSVESTTDIESGIRSSLAEMKTLIAPIMSEWETVQNEIRDSMPKPPSLKSLIKKEKGFGSFTSPVSKEEKDIVSRYENGTCFSINEFIITGKATDENLTSEELEKFSDQMSTIIDKFKLEKDLNVYRGINTVGFEGSEEYLNHFLNSSSGDIIDNPAFSSTSYSKDSAEMYSKKNGVLLSISLKEGQKVLPVNLTLGNKSDFPDNQEMILNKNSRFRIDSVDKKSRIVHVSLLDKE